MCLRPGEAEFVRQCLQRLETYALHPVFLQDGIVIIHTVRRGQFVAALRPPGAMLPGPVSHLVLGSEGQIVVQSSAWERVGAQVWKRGARPRTG